MALEAGSRLGSYEIVSRLGAGGMGEVWRARDPRLGRDVAIKLIPEGFAQDPERLARFEREARLLASLQHANIATLHGLEEDSGRRFLVMQCIEGESLAQRLARGALPVPDALEIAAAIAAGLEVAHENGVIHRDLKPGNVMVTPSGEVKVLDFGLAKGGGGSGSDPNLSASPTMTYAATSAGVVLGTAAYMSPEQARGKAVDRRTDIWSFGCVLYEMLSGRQAFAGETVSDVVACILQAEPDWSALPPTTPARVRDLLVRCLQKDARRRLRDAGDARLELEDVIAGRVSASGAHLAPATTTPRRRPWLVPALAALVVVAAAAAWFAARSSAPAASDALLRVQMDIPPRQVIDRAQFSQEISPDGTMLAIAANDSSGTSHLWLRRLDTIGAREIPGTDGVTTMFWSPDSRWIAFFAKDRQLLKVAAAGGAPQVLCDARSGRGGSWNRDGVLIFAPYSNGGIFRVSDRGGDPVEVVHPDSAHGEYGLRFPCFLPDGKHFLYSSMLTDSTGRGRICAGSLDGGPPRVVLPSETGATWAAPGWLLYGRRDILTAIRFDAGRLATVGEPVPMGDVANGNQYAGSPVVSASSNGVLAFRTDELVPERIAWVDASGRESGSVPGVTGLFTRPILSPDGHRMLCQAYHVGQPAAAVLVDLDRGVQTQIAGDDVSVGDIVWAPDGAGFGYVDDLRHSRLVLQSLAGGGKREYLLDDYAFKRLDAWSAAGNFIVYGRLDPATKWDIWKLPLAGGKPQPLVEDAGNDMHSTLSPDGKWLAWQSDESGTNEVYVKPLDGSGMRYQLTNGGGILPFWVTDPLGLLWADPRHPTQAMRADLRGTSPIAFGPARVAAVLPEDVLEAWPAPDAKRILVLLPAEKPRPQAVTLMFNWTKALKNP